jgi:hypothetical protein
VLVLFGYCVAALFAADETTLATVFAALVALHLVLAFALSQRPGLGTIPRGGQ